MPAPSPFASQFKADLYLAAGDPLRIRFILAETPIDREFVATEVARRGLRETWRAVEQ